jgi:hypothetical protein
MKKMKLLLFIIFPVFLAVFVMAQEDKKEENVPLGMEIMEIGQAKLLVPKDIKFHKEGDLVVLENSAEYVARRLSEMEERLEKIEAKEKELSEKLEQLNKILNEIQKNNLTPEKKEK